MTGTLESAARELLPGFAGKVIAPGDDDYDYARKVWNGQIDRYPAVIAQVGDTADVSAALAVARRHDLEVTVRGGAHNFAGAAVCDGGLVIDLRRLRSVSVDPVTKRARAGGGALNVDLDAATQAHGLAVPAGTVSDTGIGGLTLGGGFGWLTARHGLSIDNLVSAEVVLADGNVVRASADSHPDLFWALRGGGGNFGVVTEFEYQLHDVGPLVTVGILFWDIEQGPEVLRLCREVVPDLPKTTGSMIAGVNAPVLPWVPPEYQGKPCFTFMVVDLDSTPEEHAQLMARIRDAVPPVAVLDTPMPYVSLQRLFDAGSYQGIFAYEKSVYFDALTDDIIEVIARNLASKKPRIALTPIFPMRGAFCDVDDDATAFGGARREVYLLNILATCADGADLDGERSWVRAFWHELRPLASNGGGYVNFMAEYEGDRVRSSYGPRKYERLAAIKATYDPHNVFHHNANIRPATDTGQPEQQR